MITYGLVKQNSAFARNYKSSYDPDARNTVLIAPKYPYELEMGFASKSAYAERKVLDGQGTMPSLPKWRQEDNKRSNDKLLGQLASMLQFNQPFGKVMGPTTPQTNPPQTTPTNPTNPPTQTNPTGTQTNPPQTGSGQVQTSPTSVANEGVQTSPASMPDMVMESPTSPDPTAELQQALMELRAEYDRTNEQANALVEQLERKQGEYNAFRSEMERQMSELGVQNSLQQELIEQRNLELQGQYQLSEQQRERLEMLEKEYQNLRNMAEVAAMGLLRTEAGAERQEKELQQLRNEYDEARDYMRIVEEERNRLEAELRNTQQRGRPSLMDQAVQATGRVRPLSRVSPLSPSEGFLDMVRRESSTANSGQARGVEYLREPPTRRITAGPATTPDRPTQPRPSLSERRTVNLSVNTANAHVGKKSKPPKEKRLTTEDAWIPSRRSARKK